MDSYLRYVLPFVPGCPEALVELKILEAARALCDDALCWRLKQENSVAAEAVTVSLDLDTGAELSDIPFFSRDGRNSNEYEIGEDGDEVTIPAWSSASTVKLTIAQRPLVTATEFPAGFKKIRYQKITEAMAEMAKAIIHGMVGQPWHNPQQAMADKSAYDLYVGQIRNQILRSNTMTESRVTQRMFV